MQTVIQVLSSKSESLRERIANGARLGSHGLVVSEQKRATRPEGWAKIHSTEGENGAVNIQWIASAKTLLCRVVTKGRGDPAPITAAFTGYLLSCFKKEILAIIIRPGV